MKKTFTPELTKHIISFLPYSEQVKLKRLNKKTKALITTNSNEKQVLQPIFPIKAELWNKLTDIQRSFLTARITLKKLKSGELTLTQALLQSKDTHGLTDDQKYGIAKGLTRKEVTEVFNTAMAMAPMQKFDRIYADAVEQGHEFGAVITMQPHAVGGMLLGLSQEQWSNMYFTPAKYAALKLGFSYDMVFNLKACGEDSYDNASEEHRLDQHKLQAEYDTWIQENCYGCPYETLHKFFLDKHPELANLSELERFVKDWKDNIDVLQEAEKLDTEKRQNDAATTLQAHWKGRAARKQHPRPGL